mmetsp:Transcript_39152/g.84853  ORF Transcript_39152/g.84853 Transcript_39152/m.84853 type:complete len:119 (+) Transcript_39152:84-440(+)
MYGLPIEANGSDKIGRPVDFKRRIADGSGLLGSFGVVGALLARRTGEASLSLLSLLFLERRLMTRAGIMGTGFTICQPQGVAITTGVIIGCIGVALGTKGDSRRFRCTHTFGAGCCFI